MPDNSNPDSFEIRRVPERELRQKFNDGQIWERTLSGEFHWVAESEHTPTSPNEPPGTKSLLISIRDSREQEIARAHMYLRPDGTIGGKARRPDPKQIKEGNIIFLQQRKRDQG
jgi:hypothetical protein